MSVRRGLYHGFETIDVEWMDYKLSIAPSIGGRIISYSFQGMEAFYVMPSLEGKLFDLSLGDGESIEQKRMELGMKLYGGFKTWLAPQSRWQSAPYMDLDLAEHTADWIEEGDTVTVTLESPVCRETGVQFVRRIRVALDSHAVYVDMGMRNQGREPVEFGLWDVTQVVSPGKVYFPLGSSMGLSSLYTFERPMPSCAQVFPNGVASVDCSPNDGVYKIGTAYSEGWMLNTIQHPDGALGYLKQFEVYPDAAFGHGCAVEVYNSEDYPYYEAEIHAPMMTLMPSDEFFTTQVWSLFPMNAASASDVRSIVAKHLVDTLPV
ncbi:DUF4380 domain-containing protein [Alicyclobacillus fodiniaquatilis]|uniref:DUF4380 domain-containing protein n=1 Tax=Alicyclobacillus fodiniaquatilis TaxID=1661150 RepID=A0ABW4JJF9_9BACL